MPAPRLRPNLSSVSTIARDGSRRTVHPADVRGKFITWRRITALFLITVYVLLPWIQINGHPAVFLDVVNRRFHLFGLTLATQDLWLGFFFVTGLAFSLFSITALFGRLWCGWTCPYTVFLEHVYRRVERWIDGDALARRKLDAAPSSTGKIARRTLKHAIYLALSFIIAHVFLSYFVSLHQLYAWMHGPPAQHLFAFGVIVFLTGTLHFVFGWFREQFCIIICPYGRLQSALTDDNTVVIGYDKKRGDPRGAITNQAGGDCLDCNRCVQVCPTGIDIRNGLQLECIGCAACIDACDDVMTRLRRQTGLVRYDSLNGLNGHPTLFLRPRTLLYGLLIIIGVLAFAFSASTVKSFRMSVLRMTGSPYFVSEGIIRNQFLIRVINKRNEPATYRIMLGGSGPRTMRIAGGNDEFTLEPMGESQQLTVLTLPQSDYTGPTSLSLLVTEIGQDSSLITRELEFIGPDPRLLNDDYLNPKNYLK